jgi:hypothetical protein
MGQRRGGKGMRKRQKKKNDKKVVQPRDDFDELLNLMPENDFNLGTLIGLTLMKIAIRSKKK